VGLRRWRSVRRKRLWQVRAQVAKQVRNPTIRTPPSPDGRSQEGRYARTLCHISHLPRAVTRTDCALCRRRRTGRAAWRHYLVARLPDVSTLAAWPATNSKVHVCSLLSLRKRQLNVDVSCPPTEGWFSELFKYVGTCRRVVYVNRFRWVMFLLFWSPRKT